MNFGGFAGGFSQGFSSGTKIGTTINDLLKQDKVEKVRAMAVEEANAAHAGQVSGMVKETGLGTKPADASQSAPAAAEPAGPTMQPAPAAIVTTEPVASPSTTVMQPGMPMDASQAPAAAAPSPMTPQAITPQAATPVPGAMPPAAAGLPQQKPFMVGDQGFSTREEATAFASQKAPPLSEFTGRALAGKMEQHYMESGDIETAEKWNAWSKSKKSERNMETWAEAYKMSQNGDFAGSARALMKLYPDYNDGLTLTNTEAIKDDKGREVGFKMTVKDKNGKERTIEHDAETISRTGLQQMTPQKMFEMDRAERVGASTARAKAAADNANDRRGLQKEILVEGVKAGTRAKEADVKFGRDKEIEAIKSDRDMQKLTTQQWLDDASMDSREKRKIETKIEFLKRSGRSEEDINNLMPALVGAGEHKKTTDPEERRALIMSDLMKNSPGFSNKKPDDKTRLVNEAMDVIHGPSSPAKAPAAAGGLPQPAAAAPAAPAKGKGTPYLKPDGTIVYR